MEPKWKEFTFWFIVYFLFTQFNRDLQYFFIDNDTKWWWESRFSIIVSGFISFFLQSLISYAILYLSYPRYGLWRTLPAIILVLPLLIFIRYFIQEIILLALTGQGNYSPDTSLKYYFVDNLYFSSIYMLYSVIYFFVRFTKHQENEKLKMTNLKNEAELGYLRSQINPHFLFNSLNTTYSLIHTDKNKALRSIELLSELTRRMLYGNQEFNELNQEIKALNEYVELQKLRFDPECYVQINTSNIKPILIPAQVLIPLTENAFKHGKVNEKSSPIVIRIALEDNYVNLFFSNQILEKNRSESGGVGLQNVKRRLELLYGNKLLFEVQNDKTNFNLTIKFPVNVD